jgi:hypothetical protein
MTFDLLHVHEVLGALADIRCLGFEALLVVEDLGGI